MAKSETTTERGKGVKKKKIKCHNESEKKGGLWRHFQGQLLACYRSDLWYKFDSFKNQRMPSATSNLQIIPIIDWSMKRGDPLPKTNPSIECRIIKGSH